MRKSEEQTGKLEEKSHSESLKGIRQAIRRSENVP